MFHFRKSRSQAKNINIKILATCILIKCGSVRTTPEKYENSDFTLKSTLFRPPVKSLLILDLFEIKKKLRQVNHDYRDIIVFEKQRFQNVFHPHSNAKPAFFMNSVFGNFNFEKD